MIWFTSDLHFFHDRILEFHPKRKEIFGSTVEYDLISLEKLANHLTKIEKDNEHGMVK